MRVRDNVRLLRRQQTPAEQRLWTALRAHRLDRLHFRRQCPVGRFVADFYCAQERLVVEVDGGIHTSKHQQEHDRERDALFASLSYTVLRVSNDEVLHNLPATLDRIRTAAQVGQSSPGHCRHPSPRKRGEGPGEGSLRPA